MSIKSPHDSVTRKGKTHARQLGLVILCAGGVVAGAFAADDDARVRSALERALEKAAATTNQSPPKQVAPTNAPAPPPAEKFDPKSGGEPVTPKLPAKDAKLQSALRQALEQFKAATNQPPPPPAERRTNSTPTPLPGANPKGDTSGAIQTGPASKSGDASGLRSALQRALEEAKGDTNQAPSKPVQPIATPAAPQKTKPDVETKPPAAQPNSENTPLRSALDRALEQAATTNQPSHGPERPLTPSLSPDGGEGVRRTEKSLPKADQRTNLPPPAVPQSAGDNAPLHSALQRALEQAAATNQPPKGTEATNTSPLPQGGTNNAPLRSALQRALEQATTATNQVAATNKPAPVLVQPTNAAPSDISRERSALRRALDETLTDPPSPQLPSATNSPEQSELRRALEQAQLKPYQRTNSATPPLSPEKFNPDAGLRLQPNFIDGATAAYELHRRTNRVEPEPPPQFNPDPGASHKKNAEPLKPFFPFESVPLPVFTGEPIPDELRLARTNTRQTQLWLREPELPPPLFGWEPLTNRLALPRASTAENTPVPTHWRILDYPLSYSHSAPSNSMEMSDRYHVPFVPWRRYTSGDIETPYQFDRPFLWHPYLQSVLKGDSPIIGQDIFLNLTAGTSTELEFRRIPTPSAISSARPGSAEFFGKSEQWSVQNNLSLTIDLFQGETVFKPVEWAVRIQPIYNVNFVDVQETTVVRPDPRGFGDRDNRPPTGDQLGVNNPSEVGGIIRGGVTPVGRNLANRSHTQRTRDFIALQEAFVEIHIRDLSDNYDFIASRFGNQTFNSDFRGFLFNDTETGGRIFGNWENNLWQYNLAAFDMREKDTYSELNSLEQRDQRVVIANVYRQDALWHGYTAQLSFHANLDDGGTHYDRNGNLVRPALLGDVRPHEVNAFYFGWAGDGHIGRWNVSHQFYQVVGHDTFNGLAGRPVDISAQMGALEVSYDRDWIRYKASFFYASGDDSAEDGTATAFDTIFDNPNFTGGPFSYWVHQGFNFGGTAVGLKQRNSLVPNLRTSKGQGQANFVNPGVFIYSLGADIDTTPKLKTFLNANYIRFAETDALKTALLTDQVRGEVGWDLSIGWQYRPLLTDNIIVSAGFGVLIPGSGFRDIYRRSTSPVIGYNSFNRRGEVDDFLYSAIMAVTLTY